MISLYDHQRSAVDKLKSGSILCGGVGSGKSRTSVAYYFLKECNGNPEYTNMKNPKDLYIITTARKRDTLDWVKECAYFTISTERDASIGGVELVVDSWNNISKYIDIKDAFFIFDEQRVVGSGSWVKSFIKITRKNNWILLSATPGDTWEDYIPVFVANGFYKNRTEFLTKHAVYSRFTKYPKIDRFVDCGILAKYKHQITVMMPYLKLTVPHNEDVIVSYDKEKFDLVMVKRWNPFEDCPIKDVGQLCYTMRKVVNSDPSRMEAIKKIFEKNPRLIVFYNFDYELYMLRELAKSLQTTSAEWNGHKHEEVPTTDQWLYFVQYTAGAEGWNCTETNATAFQSQNYSYKIMIQAAGRIDRMDTKFKDLYYYHLRSESAIDKAILKSLKNKRNFNEQRFVKF